MSSLDSSLEARDVPRPMQNAATKTVGKQRESSDPAARGGATAGAMAGGWWLLPLAGNHPRFHEIRGKSTQSPAIDFQPQRLTSLVITSIRPTTSQRWASTVKCSAITITKSGARIYSRVSFFMHVPPFDHSVAWHSRNGASGVSSPGGSTLCPASQNPALVSSANVDTHPKHHQPLLYTLSTPQFRLTT